MLANGPDTSFVVQYGTGPSLAQSTPPTDVGSAGTGSCGCDPVPIQQPVFGLSADTCYYVRIAATNSSGTAYSQTLSAWMQTSSGQPGGPPAGPSPPASARDELVARALPPVGLPYGGLLGVPCSSLSFCMAVGGSAFALTRLAP
ncbi:MAG: hypothetical protein M0T77_02945 [Actinomycetota bacterium]|nr:hypothetical protein [Actinomycetota bacterium]